jgi:hypothetical protein
MSWGVILLEAITALKYSSSFEVGEKEARRKREGKVEKVREGLKGARREKKRGRKEWL